MEPPARRISPNGEYSYVAVAVPRREPDRTGDIIRNLQERPDAAAGGEGAGQI